MKELHAYFSGPVQGVGFRYTAYELAKKLKLYGFVKNLPDGRVELLAHGDRENLETLLIELKQNFPDADTEISWPKPTQEFSSFEIVV